ncbi:type IV secretion system protein [Megamonas funiformis]|jgi:type IV secretion system protein TrbL|uniref:Type IV secretion system protein n=2 Tax=Megamonas funiformis TaxID=437897 RepID=A0AAW4U7G4_9FIRM|nr:type IV secretion system protein [Megamonas funiformis]MCB6828729.1 type IV secretion system protein [Megamonas funiformis]
MKKRILILTLLIIVIISNVCFAASTDLSWNSVLEKFAGNVDEYGNLNTSGAVFTDILPRIIGTIMIVAAGYLFMMGEMSGTATTIMRIILATGLITNLGLYLNSNFFNVPQYSFAATAPPMPNAEDFDFISTFMNYYIWLCQRGANALYPYAISILISLSAIDIALRVALKMEDDIIKYILSVTLKIGFYIWLLANWINGIGIAHMLYTGFEQIGYIAALSPNSNVMPDSITKNAFSIIETSMDRVSAVSGFMTTLISVIMVLFTIIAVAITAVQLFLSRVEFWTIGTLILPLLALGTFKHFRFLFEKSIGAVFNAGIKVSVISFIISIVNPLLTEMITTYGNASGLKDNLAGMLQIVFGCFVIAMLVLKVPNLAQGLINGSPNLSDGDMYAPIQATNQMADKTEKGIQKISHALGNLTAASQREGGRQARGIPGFAGTAKQMAGQISNGQYKGAMQSGGNYLSGVAGTFANRMKMAMEGTFKSPYHDAIEKAKNRQSQINRNNAWSEIYGAQNNNPIAKQTVQDRIEQKSKEGIKANILNRASKDINKQDNKINKKK